MICAKLKIKISVYFVCSVCFILNIEMHDYENKQMGTDAFDLQEIKRVGQYFYVLGSFF